MKFNDLVRNYEYDLRNHNFSARNAAYQDGYYDAMFFSFQHMKQYCSDFNPQFETPTAEEITRYSRKEGIYEITLYKNKQELYHYTVPHSRLHSEIAALNDNHSDRFDNFSYKFLYETSYIPAAMLRYRNFDMPIYFNVAEQTYSMFLPKRDEITYYNMNAIEKEFCYQLDEFIDQMIIGSNN